MNLSFDNYISRRYGVDNQLCPVYKSISFWGYVVMTAITFAAAFRALDTFMAKGDLTVWILYVAIVVAAMGFYIAGRGKLVHLANLNWATKEGTYLRQLRAVSTVFTVLTGFVIVCVFFAMLVVRG